MDLITRLAYLKAKYEAATIGVAKYAYLGHEEVDEFENVFISQWMAGAEFTTRRTYKFVTGATVLLGLKLYSVDAKSHLAVS